MGKILQYGGESPALFRNHPSLGVGSSLSQMHGRILIVCPGGLEHGGGIGRQMLYFTGMAERCAPTLHYSVIDSRGPWFLGAARVKSLLSLGYLLSSLARLGVSRFGTLPVLAHVNITGRGSTLRKMALVSFAHAIGLKYVLHVHDYDYAADFRRRPGWQKSIIRRMFRRAERVIALGSADKASLQSAIGLSPARVTVLHNAVPDPNPQLTRQDAGPRPVSLLFLGYLSERKGVPELLAALSEDSLRSTDWKATIAGGGDVAGYRAKAEALCIADRIDFPGWIDRAGVEHAFAQADILVLPSHAEGMAMSVLEGLSHGLAVVATAVGAHAEVIEDGVSGLLLPPGDIAALTAALAKVICDTKLRQDLQQGARRRFLDKFEVSRYAQCLSRLHATILADDR